MNVMSRKRPLTREMVKTAAAERNMEISSLLSMVVREELLAAIGRSKFADYLMLERGKIHSNGVLRLIYSHDERLARVDASPGSHMNEELAEKILRLLAQPSAMYTHKVTRKKGSHQYNVEANVDGYFVPVPVAMEVDSGSAFPKKREFPRTLFPEEVFSVMVYSQTYSVSAEVFAIMRNLELLSDLSPYLKLYESLGEEDFDSIRVSARVKYLCEQQSFVPEMAQLETFAGYGEYHYMQSKWKRYLRGQKISGPAWDEVFSRVERFITPIWAGICEGEFYAADWISGAGRYLDA